MADGASLSVKVLYNHFNKIADDLPLRAALGLDRALAGVEQTAKDTAPYLTGALRASGFRISPLYSDYGQAVAAFQSLAPDADVADPPSKAEAGGVLATVGFAAGYATDVHDGHHTASGSWVPGVPWLAEAFRDHHERIIAAVADALGSGVGGGA